MSIRGNHPTSDLNGMQVESGYDPAENKDLQGRPNKEQKKMCGRVIQGPLLTSMGRN
ncbi:MAG: hypothetical protein JRE36_02360 [Deltaproteobacteria bacterium]|jgi:hypothetical protein|nr:hypothetical protein [Deltaproteobacteria bacterium]